MPAIPKFSDLEVPVSEAETTSDIEPQSPYDETTGDDATLASDQDQFHEDEFDPTQTIQSDLTTPNPFDLPPTASLAAASSLDLPLAAPSSTGIIENPNGAVELSIGGASGISVTDLDVERILVGAGLVWLVALYGYRGWRDCTTGRRRERVEGKEV